MRISRIKIAFLVICCAAIGFEVWHFRTGPAQDRQLPSPTVRKNKRDFALLPASEIPASLGYFVSPKPHAESWEPTVGDMDDVEANIPQVTALSANGSDLNSRIDDPHHYFRQYLALVLNGKRVLILNAFCTDQGHEENWRRHLVLVMDGGKCFWHVIYDPATGKFSNLSVNGVG